MPDERTRQITMLGWMLHLAGAVVAMTGVGVYLLAVHMPMQDAKQRSRDCIAVLAKLLDGADALRTEHARLAATLASHQAEATSVKQRIPDNPNEADFLRQLTEAAAHEKLTINDFTRGDITAHSGFSQLDVQLACRGTYESICRFLERVEELPRVTKIVEMDITSDGHSDTYPLNLTIRLFFGARGTT